MLDELATAIVRLSGTDPVAVAIREARDSFNRAIALETGTWRGAPQAGGDDYLGGSQVAKWTRAGDRWIPEAEIFATMTCGGGLCPTPKGGAP